MMDIFGQPDWLGLVGGVFSEIVDGLVELLNWLSLILPFPLAGGTHAYFRSRNVPNAVAVIPAVFVFALVITVYYFAYPHLRFPLWMGWFH